MWEEAATAGQFEYGGVKYDRMQLLTVGDILEGKREFHTPDEDGIPDFDGSRIAGALAEVGQWVSLIKACACGALLANPQYDPFEQLALSKPAPCWPMPS